MRVKSWLLAIGVVLVAAVASSQTVVVSYDKTNGEVPVGIAVDKTGDFWVSLQPICELRRYSPHWQETAVVQLSCPAGSTGTGGVAIDATGTVYVTLISPDDGARGVWRFETAGTPQRVPGTQHISFPNSIAFDHQNGTMYVTDMTAGRIYRVRRGGAAEIWAEGPALQGLEPMNLGANGIAISKGNVLVSVTLLPRIVKIPIEKDGSAGDPAVLYPPPSLQGEGIFALDDVVLDVFGNIYAGMAFGLLPVVARLAGDGSGIAPMGELPASPLTLAFGTGKGLRRTLLVGFSDAYQGTGSGIAELAVGVPGQPVP